MSDLPFKVFRHGDGTARSTQIINGERVEHLYFGKGTLVDPRFATVEEARDFCTSQIQLDPAAVFWILQGDRAVETLANHEYHRKRDEHQERVFALLSTLIVIVLSLIVLARFAPFDSIWADIVTAAGIGLFHVFAMWTQGGSRNLESYVATLLLVGGVAMTISFTRGCKQHHQPPGRSPDAVEAVSGIDH